MTRDEPGDVPEWTDDELVAAFEAARIGKGCFSHEKHVRVARFYLRRHGLVEGSRRMRAGIRNLIAALGVERVYHETRTEAWLRILWQALQGRPAGENFERFAAGRPEVLDSAYLLRFWHAGTLESEEARERFIPPDRAPLPGSPDALGR